MFYRQASNQYINENTQFEIDGVTYPSVWLNQSTPEQKAELGLEEVIATNQPFNPVYYWTGEVLDKATLIYIGTPKNLDEVKLNAINQVDSSAYSILLPTDYVEARNLRNPEYKLDWMLWRDSIRATAKETMTAINGAVNVDEVATIMANIVWPNDPNSLTV